MQFEIRDLRDAEYQHVLAFMALLEPNLSAEVVAERMTSMLASNWRCLGVFSMGDQQPIGIAGYSFRTHLFSGKTMYVENVALLPQLRGAGIGEKLMARLQDIALAADCKMISLDAYQKNAGARRFYERLGYDPRGVHFVLELPQD
jgi:GNAT superfamily N-acetyltransferase